MNSTHYSTAVPGGPELDESDLMREVPAGMLDIHDRAVSLLRSADPLVPALMEPTFLHYWSGYQHGHADAIRNAHARAEAAAADFLVYLAEDPGATPVPLPPLENDWRDAA